MSKNMKNDSVKSIIVLTVICLVISAALAITNYFTHPIIEEAEAEKNRKALGEVIEGVENFEETELEGAPSGITAFYKAEDKGYVALISAKGYGSSPITAAVGFDKDGKIIKLVVINCSGETPGKGDIVASDGFRAQFAGKDAALEGVDTVSGATISTRGLKNAVKSAAEAVKNYIDKEAK